MENFNDVNWNAVAVILGVIAVFGILLRFPVQEYIRGLKMKQKRREEIQYSFISTIVEGVENDVLAGNLTREEATKEIYEPLKRVFSCHKDLYPSEKWLKERIETRMASGNHAPVPLPDVQVVKKRKHLFDKG